MLHQFSFVLAAFRSNGKSLVTASVLLQTGRKEYVPPRCAAIYNDGQRNDNLRFSEIGDVPFVRIADMPEHDFLYVYRILLLLGRSHIVTLGHAVEFGHKTVLRCGNTVGLHRSGR